MFKKLALFCCCLSLFLLAGCGSTQKVDNTQVASYPGWIRVNAGQQASFSVPPELAEESQEYVTAQLQKEDLNPLLRKWLTEDQITGKSAGCVIAQTTDVTALPWEGDNHYARVEFKTMPTPEKLPKYGQNLGLKAAEIKDFGDITQKALTGMAQKDLPEGYSLNFHDWQPMKSVIINGVESLYTSYEEDVVYQNKLQVTFHVERWTFFNRDRVHTLTVTSRKQDKAYWEDESRPLYKKLVNTLKITASEAK